MNTLKIKSELFTWARERSGRDIEYWIKIFPKLTAWENGEKQPTLNELEKLARKTYTPLGYFFLREPPDETLPIANFRTLGDKNIHRPSPNLLDTVQTMIHRQSWMRDFLIEDKEEPLRFVGSANNSTSVFSLVQDIRFILGLKEDWVREYTTWKEALYALRNAIDNAGILFAKNGVVGNDNHRKLEVEEFRGFVLIDKYAPLIFINGSDSEGAQMFTIAHELAHIWIGSSAIFNLLDMQPFDNVTEIYCNRVAAEFLVPEKRLRDLWRTVENSDDPYKLLSREFKVSKLVLARRALDLGFINRKQFLDFYHRYKDEQEEYTLKKKSKKNKGNFYNNQNVRIGKRFARAVFIATKEGRLLYRDAFKLTGLSQKTFNTYAGKIGFQ